MMVITDIYVQNILNWLQNGKSMFKIYIILRDGQLQITNKKIIFGVTSFYI